MMRLFRSFDLYFYPFSIFSSLTLLLLIFKRISFSILNYLYNTLFSFFERFFNTLKIKSINIISMPILLTFLIYFIFFNSFSIFSYNFAFTSHISIVILISLTLWLSIILFSSLYNMKGLIEHCVPQGSPLYLITFLWLIEIVSNLIRPLTLTVRLTANILSGHLLIILLSSLVFNNVVFGFLYIILNMVEIFVALIQSYIFLTITCLYYRDLC